MSANSKREYVGKGNGYWCDVKDWKKIHEELDPITRETNKIIDDIVKQEELDRKAAEKEGKDGPHY